MGRERRNKADLGPHRRDRPTVPGHYVSRSHEHDGPLQCDLFHTIRRRQKPPKTRCPVRLRGVDGPVGAGPPAAARASRRDVARSPRLRRPGDDPRDLTSVQTAVALFRITDVTVMTSA